jgi:hypothetical protein
MITAAMRTANAVPMTESSKRPLRRELVVDKMTSDAMLNAITPASTPRVRVRALALPVKSKYPVGKPISPRIA